MPIYCDSYITVLGLEGSLDVVLEAFSQALFKIPLSEAREHRLIESWDAPVDRGEKFGLSCPRFKLEWRWEPPINEIREASRTFPQLTFHAYWKVEFDGPRGEFVIQNGEVREFIERQGSPYMVLPQLQYPWVSLLHAHLPLTEAQRATQCIDNAVAMVRTVRDVLYNPEIVESRYKQYRDAVKLAKVQKQLDELLNQMKSAAAEMDFDRVLLEYIADEVSAGTGTAVSTEREF